jgi:hypothetical protein
MYVENHQYRYLKPPAFPPKFPRFNSPKPILNTNSYASSPLFAKKDQGPRKSLRRFERFKNSSVVLILQESTDSNQKIIMHLFDHRGKGYANSIYSLIE